MNIESVDTILFCERLMFSMIDDVYMNTEPDTLQSDTTFSGVIIMLQALCTQIGSAFFKVTLSFTYLITKILSLYSHW